MTDGTQRLDHRLGGVVPLRLADHDDIDVVRECAGLAVVSRGPGAADERLLDAGDTAQRILDGRLGAVTEKEQARGRVGQSREGVISR